MITYRCANPSEWVELNHFIRLSKGFWGYTAPFLDTFMEKWGLKESFLQKNEVILLEQDKHLVGLYAFKMNEEKLPELDLFLLLRLKFNKESGS
ncbi:hypothetical protein [Legionella tunisiensis]|uniref:hypothetical protein n=1 Tax=Legionella tunisiensis TaxID=1034944 RepID=UPI00031D2F1C|nr:hypothetical protein [Legionella tunisiensis]